MIQWGNIMTASRLAMQAFRLAMTEPYGTHMDFESQIGTYNMLWQYYRNEAYSELDAWASYVDQRGLYRNTVNLYNPVRRLVDFYAGIVYSGMLTPDGMPHDDGQPSAIPFDRDMSPELVIAIAQVFQWSNWAINNHVMVRYGAALGSVLTEVRDDPERGRIQLAVVWPGFVTDLDLDDFGNVKGYTIEYRSYDREEEREYDYKREVDGESIRTYKDNRPFSYDGDPAEHDNPYGFVPAVWAKHVDNGTDHGSPAVRSISKIDYLNSLASHAIDQVHKIVGAPVVVAGDNMRRLIDDEPLPHVDRRHEQDTMDIIQAAAGSSVHALYTPPGEALNHIQQLTTEIEEDHPELSMYQQLRSMERVSGPGADRMFGDVAAYVAEARSAYDQALVKLCQMSVAIGGFRANGGGWTGLNHQQQKFTPFDLESWQDDQLGISIMPRPLFMPSEYERLQIELARMQLEQAKASLASPQVNGGANGITERIRQIAESDSQAEQAALTPQSTPTPPSQTSFSAGGNDR